MKKSRGGKGFTNPRSGSSSPKWGKYKVPGSSKASKNALFDKIMKKKLAKKGYTNPRSVSSTSSSGSSGSESQI